MQRKSAFGTHIEADFGMRAVHWADPEERLLHNTPDARRHPSVRCDQKTIALHAHDYPPSLPCCSENTSYTRIGEIMTCLTTDLKNGKDAAGFSPPGPDGGARDVFSQDGIPSFL